MVMRMGSFCIIILKITSQYKKIIIVLKKKKLSFIDFINFLYNFVLLFFFSCPGYILHRLCRI